MRIDELLGIKSDYREKLAALNEQYESVSSAVDALEEQVRESRMKAAEQSDLAAQYREDIHGIELSNSQAAAKTAVLENDIKHLEDRKAAIADSIEQSRSSAYFLESKLNTI